MNNFEVKKKQYKTPKIKIYDNISKITKGGKNKDTTENETWFADTHS